VQNHAMEPPDPARQHVKGVITAGLLLLVTVVSAVGLIGVLFVGLGRSDGAESVSATGPGGESAPALLGPVVTTTTEVPTTTTTTTTTAPPTTAPPTTAAPAPPPPPPPAPGGALCIGDSVMQSASPKYYNLLGMCGVVDATVSRSWGAGSSAVRSHAPYPDRVVIHLGTNGFTNAGEIDAALQAVADVPRVVLVTVQLNGTRRWEESVNAEIRAAATRWPNVRIADWQGVSAGHPEFFRSDRIHPSHPGAVAYANVIAAAL
jgi:lysophospholipase L1-like esterase